MTQHEKLLMRYVVENEKNLRMLQRRHVNAEKLQNAAGRQQSLRLRGHAYLCNCQRCQSDTTIATSGLEHRRTMLHLRVTNVNSGDHNDGPVQLV